MKFSEQRVIGFTIVELLIVIVVIGILASITIVAFNGVQERAHASKIDSDLKSLKSAILSARISSDTTLWALTGGRSGGDGLITADTCNWEPDGTDFSELPASSQCWTKYNDTLEAISAASGANVRGLKDPYGRPYFIYENEGRAANPCQKDELSAFSRPHVMWGAMWAHTITVPNSLSGC